MFSKLISVLLLAIVCTNADKFRFDNYTLYKVIPQNYEHIKLLQNLHDSDNRYDFWSDPVPTAEFVKILSAPENKQELESFLNDHGLTVEVSMANIQEIIDKQKVKKYTRTNTRSMGWDGYYPLEDINAWLDDLVIQHPTVATKIIAGKTYEGRDIEGIKISHGTAKRGIFIEGGIHSREWISPATVTYIINELLTSDNEETVNAAHDYDWYLFPVTNPDGYIWTHESFRLWRKNRRPVGSQYGIDLNRNWNNNWLVVGASTNPSSNTYAGLGPFSEPETRSLSEFIRSVADHLDIYLSFHSAGQLMMVPFGNTTGQYANYHDAINIGRRAMGALSVRYGTEYVTGNIAEAIYQATGSSVDWVKEEFNVPLVYCYELRDRGQYGFLLPEDQILPNSQEVMDSVLELIHQGKRFGVISGASGMQAASVLILIVASAVTFNLV